MVDNELFNQLLARFREYFTLRDDSFQYRFNQNNGKDFLINNNEITIQKDNSYIVIALYYGFFRPDGTIDPFYQPELKEVQRYITEDNLWFHTEDGNNKSDNNPGQESMDVAILWVDRILNLPPKPIA